jgi:hypothetical protein
MIEIRLFLNCKRFSFILFFYFYFLFFFFVVGRSHRGPHILRSQANGVYFHAVTISLPQLGQQW